MEEENDIKNTSEWIDSMFDNIPVQYYFSEIEDRKHTNRRFKVDKEEVLIDMDDFNKREFSAEGKMTVSEYNKLQLEKKRQEIEKTQEMEEINDFDLNTVSTKNPKEELSKRLHNKIEEIKKNKGNNANGQITTHEKALPATKKHQKRNDKKGNNTMKKNDTTDKPKDEKHQDKSLVKPKPKHQKKPEKLVKFERPAMASPELRENLDFGTISFSKGKSVPKYLTKK